MLDDVGPFSAMAPQRRRSSSRGVRRGRVFYWTVRVVGAAEIGVWMRVVDALGLGHILLEACHYRLPRCYAFWKMVGSDPLGNSWGPLVSIEMALSSEALYMAFVVAAVGSMAQVVLEILDIVDVVLSIALGAAVKILRMALGAGIEASLALQNPCKHLGLGRETTTDEAALDTLHLEPAFDWQFVTQRTANDCQRSGR